jgi:hypothetical protein
MRRATFMSLRLPADFPLNDPHWQTVMQMKQTEPYNDPGNGPVIEMEIIDGRWTLYNSWNELWSAPATAGSWTRFGFDVVYSQNPSIGSIQMHVDLNGDGDVTDPNETSPLFHAATLRTEVAGPDTRVPVGSSIPSHLRAGLYHDPAIPCPPPGGCHVDLDNVQVIAP